MKDDEIVTLQKLIAGKRWLLTCECDWAPGMVSWVSGGAWVATGGGGGGGGGGFGLTARMAPCGAAPRGDVTSTPT